MSILVASDPEPDPYPNVRIRNVGSKNCSCIRSIEVGGSSMDFVFKVELLGPYHEMFDLRIPNNPLHGLLINGL
jgi:hypothetical protein